jgi:hypothetical protein
VKKHAAATAAKPEGTHDVFMNELSRLQVQYFKVSGWSIWGERHHGRGQRLEASKKVPFSIRPALTRRHPHWHRLSYQTDSSSLPRLQFYRRQHIAPLAILVQVFTWVIPCRFPILCHNHLCRHLFSTPIAIHPSDHYLYLPFRMASPLTHVHGRHHPRPDSVPTTPYHEAYIRSLL